MNLSKSKPVSQAQAAKSAALRAAVADIMKGVNVPAIPGAAITKTTTTTAHSSRPAAAASPQTHTQVAMEPEDQQYERRLNALAAKIAAVQQKPQSREVSDEELQSRLAKLKANPAAHGGPPVSDAEIAARFTKLTGQVPIAFQQPPGLKLAPPPMSDQEAVRDVLAYARDDAVLAGKLADPGGAPSDLDLGALSAQPATEDEDGDMEAYLADVYAQSARALQEHKQGLVKLGPPGGDSKMNNPQVDQLIADIMKQPGAAIEDDGDDEEENESAAVRRIMRAAKEEAELEKRYESEGQPPTGEQPPAPAAESPPGSPGAAGT